MEERPFRAAYACLPLVLNLGSSSTAKTKNPSGQPLLWAALSFASGLWAGKYLWRPPSWWVIAALVFAASAGYLLKRRVLAPRALVLAAVFVAGILTIQVRGSGDSGQVWLGDGEPVFVTARVVAEGNVQADGPVELHQRIDVETEKIESAQASTAQSRDVRAGVRLNIYSRMEEDDSPPASPTSAMQLFHYGQRIRFPAILVVPRKYRNPGAFDYAGYLREKGIIATASTKYAAIQVFARFFRQPLYVRAGADPSQRH